MSTRIASAAAVALAAAACAPDPAPRPPNVVLISIDSLRADHLGCYGYRRPTSPAIDRLAAEGALFEVATSSSSWTLPAHAALFTALPDSVHGCDRGSRTLAPERRTLAEAMQAAGYVTAGVWSGPLLHPSFGLAQGFDAWISHRDGGTEAIVRGVPETWTRATALSREDVTSPRILERANDWLETWSRSPDRRPFFLFLHFWDPHYDYIPPPPYDSMFDPGYAGAEDGRQLADYVRLREGDLAERDLEHLIARYDGEIAWTDRHVGELMETLRALHVADETVVVVTADHGEEFFEHGLFGHKRQLFDESIRIPLIVRFPARIAAGSRPRAPVRIVDVAPTLLELAGAEPLPDVMGRSLLPLLAGEPLPAAELAVSELDREANAGGPLLAVRSAEWKLLTRPASGQTVGLWDLAKDPGETLDVYGRDTALTATAEQALRRTRRELEQLRARHGGARQTSRALPEELMRELESLGYLDDASPPPEAGTAGRGLRADPNPVVMCDGSKRGRTTISWSFPDAEAPLEVRVGSAGGKLMARGGVTGSAETGRWVRDGARFFVVEAGSGEVLARTVVTVTAEGCGGRPGAATGGETDG